MSIEQTKKLKTLFKSSIKGKDLELFRQALSLNDVLNLIPVQDITSMVECLFNAKTTAGWKNAMDFNDALDDNLKVSEATITKKYLPLVGRMSWNSTPSHLKEEWWNEVGTRVATFTSKRQKKSLKEALPHVDAKGIVLDWSGTFGTQKLSVSYQNGKIETISKDLGLGLGSSKITLDWTCAKVSRGLIDTYKFIN